MKSYKHIILEKRDRIGIITLNRPEKLNALNQDGFRELYDAVKKVDQDSEMRVLVLKGAGRAFCAGADFKFSEVAAGKVKPQEAEEVREIFEAVDQGRFQHHIGAEAILALHRLSKPSIAMVNGDAVGGGFDLALACDIRVGCPRTRFMVGYTRMAVIPDLGGVWFLPRIVGLGKALELILTADFVSAEEALKLGILNKLVPEEELEKATIELAEKLAAGPPIALRLSKLLTYKSLEMDLETSLHFLSACLSITVHSEDYLEAIKAFVEKRKPEFKGR